MSEENVEIVRRQWQAWNEGDLNAWAECWDRDVVVLAPKGWPEGEESRGIEAWRLQAERLRNTWEEARIEIDDIRPVGEDRVLAKIRYVTRGKDTGLAFDTPLGVVLVLLAGSITRADFFWNYGEALEAAGLSE